MAWPYPGRRRPSARQRSTIARAPSRSASSSSAAPGVDRAPVMVAEPVDAGGDRGLQRHAGGGHEPRGINRRGEDGVFGRRDQDRVDHPALVAGGELAGQQQEHDVAERAVADQLQQVVAAYPDRAGADLGDLRAPGGTFTVRRIARPVPRAGAGSTPAG